MIRVRSRGPIARAVGGVLIAAVGLSAIARWWMPKPDPSGLFGFVPGSYGEQSLKPTRTPKIGQAPNAVLVAFRPNANGAARRNAMATAGVQPDLRVVSPYFGRVLLTPEAIARGATVESTIAALRRHPAIRLAEPDRQILKEQIPNDPNFNQQFGLHNTGQSGGRVDADIDAPEAWAALPSAAPVILAVLDDGVAIDHPDLSGNIYVNPGEIAGNGVDDDGNGFVDDVRGWDFANNDNDPRPASNNDSHGTHVAGIAAAVTGNGVGIAGTAKNARIMPIRMYRGQTTWMSDLIRGIDYAWQNGAKVISVSYNIDGYTQLLVEAIQRAGAADVVYANSAGNNGQNIDNLRGAIKRVAPNATFIAATNRNDQLASFSNFGSTVDVAIAGEDIYSTLPGNTYGNMSGTSMATPMAAGVIASLRSRFPTQSAVQIIARLAGSAEVLPQLTGRIAFGRVNFQNALDQDSVNPSDPGAPALLRRSATTLRLQFTASGDDGTSGSASRYDVRISPNPINAGNFGAALPYAGEVPTGPAGTTLRLSLAGLPTSSAFYVGIRAFDNVGNQSGVVSAGPFRTAAANYTDPIANASSFTPQAGSAWATTNAQFNSPSLSWTDSPAGNYANNADTSLTSAAAIPLPGPATLRVFARTDLESGYDFLNIQTSIDGGNTWVTGARITGVSGWRSYSIPLPAGSAQGLRIRFNMTTDGSVVGDGVWVDDIQLIGLREAHRDNLEGAQRFVGDSPWAITTTRSNSPTRSWTDSPAGNYANNVSSWLRGNTEISTEDVAGPAVAFAGHLNLESGYDFLEVYSSNDSGTTWSLRGRFTGAPQVWGAYGAAIDPSAPSQRLAFRLVTDGSVVQDGVFVDDVAVVGEPFVNGVEGSLGVDGYAGNPAGRTVRIAFRNPGTTTVVQAINLPLVNAGGGRLGFTIDTDLTGTYDLAIEGGPFLRRTLPNVTLGAATTISANLVNGDIDRDNRVTAADRAILSAAFGTSNALADLNGDGTVNAADLAILTRNFRKVGDR